MRESLALFQAILSLPWFRKVAIILFLNKNDVFKEKILHTDLGISFPNYSGGMNYENALAFITEEYRKLIPAIKRKQFFVHVTDATDTGQIQNVWHDVHKTVINLSLIEAGLDTLNKDDYQDDCKEYYNDKNHEKKKDVNKGLDKNNNKNNDKNNDIRPILDLGFHNVHK